MVVFMTRIRHLLLAGTLAWPTAYASYDVLDLPAVPSDLAPKSLLYSVSRVGDRLLATGHHGHIIYSDDNGETWTQAEVPVRSSILDLHFPRPELGWAVGHDGVILHSSDGGASWVKQYDGRQYGKDGLALYQELLQQDPADEMLQMLVEEMQFAIEQGADKPFFGVHFHSDTFGHVAGAYGMFLWTLDGGKTWEHRMHIIENYGFNHLFDFTELDDGRFFIAGEIGLALVGDLGKQSAVALSTPWEGSFFTCITANDGSVIMAGLRGRAYRTVDVGETWTAVEKPPSSSLVDSIVLSDGRVLLAGQAGDILLSDDDGISFNKIQLPGVERIYAVAEIDPNTLLIAGPNGIQRVRFEH
ncbi:MAG: YCF48-related protein [Xanthomonadales bacterium]|nr:YCF48-related protein [Xanthomonadales bacterium]